jgi:VWFA-related protein
MKNILGVFFFIAAGAGLPQISHEVRVINVEVPVRVFAGDKFADYLKLNDFEVLEDGVPQKIDALYLVRKTAVERKDVPAVEPKVGEIVNLPDTSRYFYLIFSLADYDQKIPEALSYFFKSVLRSGDHLFIITPRAVYDMKKEAIGTVSIEATVDRLKKIIRNDIRIGNNAYRAVISDLKRMVQVGGIEKATDDKIWDAEEEFTAYGSGDIREYFQKLRSDVTILENLRPLKEEKLLQFAESLKKINGRKLVIIFYQKETVPIMRWSYLMTIEDDPVIKLYITDLFDQFNRAAMMDVPRLKQAFSDSTISLYFSYLTNSESDLHLNQMAEHTEDVFRSFDAVAKATGGTTSSSANTAFLMLQAAQAADNYYLLYYSPKNKTVDQKFRSITVRVKSGNYRIAHLEGYFAK